MAEAPYKKFSIGDVTDLELTDDVSTRPQPLPRRKGFRGLEDTGQLKNPVPKPRRPRASTEIPTQTKRDVANNSKAESGGVIKRKPSIKENVKLIESKLQATDKPGLMFLDEVSA